MVLINFYFIKVNDAATQQKEPPYLPGPQGSLASGEWFPVASLERNDTTTTKDSTASPQDCDSTSQIRVHQARINFDFNGSPECIFIRDSDCDNDDWSVSTIGRSISRLSYFKPVTTPIVKGTF
jgi:hypothetical protein